MIMRLKLFLSIENSNISLTKGYNDMKGIISPMGCINHVRMRVRMHAWGPILAQISYKFVGAAKIGPFPEACKEAWTQVKKEAMKSYYGPTKGSHLK
jgi:hypothetical protein